MGEIGDLGRWEGVVGEYVSTCQVSQGLMEEEKLKMRERRWRLGVLGSWLGSGNSERRDSNAGSHRAQRHS